MQQRQIQIVPERAKAELCKRYFREFFREFWDIIEAVELVPNWHIDKICDHVQEAIETWERGESQDDILINVPPGTSKSTMITQLLNAWIWTRNRSVRVISSSYSHDLSTVHAVKTRDVITSEKYQRYYPGWLTMKKDQAGKTHFKNTHHGERFTTSTGGRVLGMHGDIIIIDDPIDPQSADVHDGKALENAYRFVSRTLSSRKTDKKRTLTIMVMQRLHENDPAGMWLKKKKRINHICLPGKLTPNTVVMPAEWQQYYVNGLLDVNRLDQDALDKLNEDLGSYGYANQILQLTAPPDGGIWKKWLKVIPRNQMPDRNAMADCGNDWDTAYTEDQKNDASAYISSGKVGNNQYIYDLGFKKLEFPDLIHYMSLREGPHYIEAKASGKSATQALSAMGIIALEVSVPGGDKTARTKLVTPRAEAGFIYIADDLAETLYNHEEQGILKFPNGRHDDLNDALVQSINRHFKREPKAWAG